MQFCKYSLEKCVHAKWDKHDGCDATDYMVCFKPTGSHCPDYPFTDKPSVKVEIEHNTDKSVIWHYIKIAQFALNHIMSDCQYTQRDKLNAILSLLKEEELKEETKYYAKDREI